MPTKPAFITFTGADHHTCIDGMIALSKRYPIEWGILFSAAQQGKGRYPKLDWVAQLLRPAGLKDLQLSAHICGAHSRDILKTGACAVDTLLASGVFNRAQINSADKTIDPLAIQAWGKKHGVLPILQARGAFPAAREVQWLLDESGGRGLVKDVWPEPLPDGVLHGYAGGLSPENVVKAVDRIGERAATYWIDMESSLRTADDVFDLARCRAVCEAVYGR